MNILRRAVAITVLHLAAWPTAVAAADAYAVIEEVRGTAMIERNGSSETASAGRLLGHGDTLRVEEGEASVMVLESTVHRFAVHRGRPWRVDATQLRSIAGFTFKFPDNAVVTRAGDQAVATLPLHTRLSKPRLTLAWAPPGVRATANVTVTDDMGAEVFMMVAQDAIELNERSFAWQRGTTYRWRLQSEMGQRDGTFTVLQPEALAALKAALVAVPGDDITLARRLQAAVLLSHGMHVDAVGLLSRLLMDAPADPVATAWLNATRAEHFTSLP